MDDKSKRGIADRLRINLNEKYEVKAWTEKFKVTEEELKKAVSEVGVMAEDVEAQLKEMKKKSNG